MKWYIEQKVLFCPPSKKPQETVITGIKNTICKCGGCIIECSAAIDYGTTRWHCEFCNASGHEYIGRWRHERLFRPLEDNFAEEVLEKALKEGIKLADELPRKV